MTGWVVSMHIYRLRLEWIIERMVNIDYLSENSNGVVSYTSSLASGIVGYLRSIKTPSLLDEQRLLRLVHLVMDKQEDQLENILVRFNYEIEDQSTLSLLGIDIDEQGSSVGRVEGVSIHRTACDTSTDCMPVYSPGVISHIAESSQSVRPHAALLAQ